MALIKTLSISKEFFRQTTISFGNFHNLLTLSSSINTGLFGFWVFFFFFFLGFGFFFFFFFSVYKSSRESFEILKLPLFLVKIAWAIIFKHFSLFFPLLSQVKKRFYIVFKDSQLKHSLSLFPLFWIILSLQ